MEAWAGSVGASVVRAVPSCRRKVRFLADILKECCFRFILCDHVRNHVLSNAKGGMFCGRVPPSEKPSVNGKACVQSAVPLPVSSSHKLGTGLHTCALPDSLCQYRCEEYPDTPVPPGATTSWVLEYGRHEAHSFGAALIQRHIVKLVEAWAMELFLEQNSRSPTRILNFTAKRLDCIGAVQRLFVQNNPNVPYTALRLCARRHRTANARVTALGPQTACTTQQ
eukprot:1234030-Rhodomonas_salina.1